MEVFSNEELFLSAWLIGGDIHSCTSLEVYYSLADDWHFFYDEIKRRGLELAYMDYCEKRDLLGGIL